MSRASSTSCNSSPAPGSHTILVRKVFIKEQFSIVLRIRDRPSTLTSYSIFDHQCILTFVGIYPRLLSITAYHRCITHSPRLRSLATRPLHSLYTVITFPRLDRPTSLPGLNTLAIVNPRNTRQQTLASQCLFRNRVARTQAERVSYFQNGPAILARACANTLCICIERHMECYILQVNFRK